MSNFDLTGSLLLQDDLARYGRGARA